MLGYCLAGDRVRRRAHPNVALLVRRQDHRHRLRMDRLHDRIRLGRQEAIQEIWPAPPAWTHQREFARRKFPNFWRTITRPACRAMVVASGRPSELVGGPGLVCGGLGKHSPQEQVGSQMVPA